MKKQFLILILLNTLVFTINGDSITLGDNTSENGLIYPKKIMEGPDKNIYIYDSQDAFIKVFSGEGGFLRKIGGQGEGPGQVKRADGLDFGFVPGKEEVFFTEYFRGHNWITFTDLKGVLKGTTKYKLNGFYGIVGAYIIDENTIFLRLDRSGKTIRKNNIYYSSYPSEILTMDGKGSKTSSVLMREHFERISFIKTGGDMGIPFTPKFLWVVTKKGDVIFTDGTENKLGVYDKKGKIRKMISVPVPNPEKITEKDLNRWREKRKGFFVGNQKTWYKKFGSVIEKYTRSLYKFKPVILEMSLTPDENLLLTCRSKKENTFIYLLVNVKGDLIYKSESKFTKIIITKSYILFSEYSEDEETEIKLIHRSGSEKKDFLRIFKTNQL